MILFSGPQIIFLGVRDKFCLEAEDASLHAELGVSHDLRSPGAKLDGDDCKDSKRKSLECRPGYD